eukprot:14485127-Alexandrium_andersonii.AAC.1
MELNPADEALQGGIVEAPPGSAHFKLGVPPAAFARTAVQASTACHLQLALADMCSGCASLRIALV